MEDSGRKMAVSVRTWDPSSGTEVKFSRIEKIAGLHV